MRSSTFGRVLIGAISIALQTFNTGKASVRQQASRIPFTSPPTTPSAEYLLFALGRTLFDTENVSSTWESSSSEGLLSDAASGLKKLLPSLKRCHADIDCVRFAPFYFLTCLEKVNALRWQRVFVILRCGSDFICSSCSCVGNGKETIARNSVYWRS